MRNKLYLTCDIVLQLWVLLSYESMACVLFHSIIMGTSVSLNKRKCNFFYLRSFLRNSTLKVCEKHAHHILSKTNLWSIWNSFLLSKTHLSEHMELIFTAQFDFYALGNDWLCVLKWIQDARCNST